MHLSPLIQRKERDKKAKRQKQNKTTVGPKQQRQEEALDDDDDDDDDCPWLYLQPMDWILLSSSWKAMMANRASSDTNATSSSALRCPGRHCNVVLGSMMMAGGGQRNCFDCGSAVPRLMIQIDRRNVTGQ